MLESTETVMLQSTTSVHASVYCFFACLNLLILCMLESTDSVHA